MSIDAIRARWARQHPIDPYYEGCGEAYNDILHLLAALDALTAERDDWEATAEVLGNESLAVTLIAGQHDAALARCAELEAANHALNAMRDEALARVTRLEATLKRWWCE